MGERAEPQSCSYLDSLTECGKLPETKGIIPGKQANPKPDAVSRLRNFDFEMGIGTARPLPAWLHLPQASHKRSF
jgi:hypothetical protein